MISHTSWRGTLAFRFPETPGTSTVRGAPPCSSGEAIALLDLFRVPKSGPESGRDVVGHVIAADRQHRRVLHHPVVVNREGRGAAAHVDHRNTEFAFFLGQHGFGRAQRRQHNSATVRLLRLQHLIMFCIAVAAPVTM